MEPSEGREPTCYLKVTPYMKIQLWEAVQLVKEVLLFCKIFLRIPLDKESWITYNIV